MIQNFKRCFFSLSLQPGKLLLLAGTACVALGAVLCSAALELLAVFLLLPVAIWQHVGRRPVGHNFVALPSMPVLDGKPYFVLGQRRRKDAGHKSCRELQRSLVLDKRNLRDQLPKGSYQAITHENVLHFLRECDYIQVDAEPRLLYQDTLRPVLMNQTKGRCRRCEAPCRAWRSRARNFYLVRFTAL